MKKFTFLIAILITGLMAQSQPITGTKTIPGDYATIADAVSALNTNGVGSGGVAFNVAAGHTESVSYILLNTTTSSAANPIVFQKYGSGDNPEISSPSGGAGTIDAVFYIAGTDYLTIDGIDIYSNSTTMDLGYALVKKNATAPFDGCQHIIIRNCTITMNPANTKSKCIYSGNHVYNATTSLSLTSASDIMSYVKIYNNTIANGYNGIHLDGYNTGNINYLDNYIDIGVDGANIVNINPAVYEVNGSSGIYVTNANNARIAYNTVTVNAGTPYSITGINSGAGSNCNFDVYDNHVTINTFGNVGVMSAFIINIGTDGGSNTVNVYNNYVENCAITGNTSGDFRAFCVFSSAKTMNFYNNYVINNQMGSGTTTSSGYFYGLLLHAYTTAGGSIHNVYNNTISGNSRLQSVPGNGISHMISCQYSAQTLNVYGNLIENNSFPTGSSEVAGIYGQANSTNRNIHHNIIRSNSTTNGTLYGMWLANGTNNQIYQNDMYELSGSGTSPSIYGIYHYNGSNSYYSNNLVSDLRAPNGTGTNAITGMYMRAGTNIYFYYNTIFLNATSSSTSTFGTSGLYTTDTPTLISCRNNIIVNISTPVAASAAAYAVAHRRSSTGVSNFTANSNNNCYYAGTSGNYNLIYHDGVNTDQTIVTYTGRMYPGELASFSEMPPFVNTSTTPYDLHLQAASITGCESGGTTVSITTDYDDQYRFPNVGYPDDPAHPATAPDVGADEFAGQAVDNTPPTIIFTPIANTTLTTPQTLQVTVLDEAGVPTSGAGLPVLYWRINSGSWNTVTATYVSGSNYEFSLGSGVVQGDYVYYYVVAQDNAAPPNVGTSPDLGITSYSSSPPACSPAPANAQYYRILIQLTGSYTVPGSFPNLTGEGGLFQTINDNMVIGDMHVTITSDLAEPGTYALNQMPTLGGNWSLNISPNSTMLRTISGSYPGGLIRLNGADRVTFDGRFGGSGTNLAFYNASTTANSAVFQVISLGLGQGASDNTIRNCFIYAGSNSVTSTFGIFAGGASISTTGSGADNDNLSLIGNVFTHAWYGIYVVGETSGINNGLLISGNLVGDETASSFITGTGIYVKQSSGTIENNMIKNIQNATTTPPIGLYIGPGSTNVLVSKNDIHGIKYTGTSNYGGHGIDIQGNVSNFTISNNLVYDIFGNGNSSLTINGITGIRLVGGCISMNLYYNTIHLFGTYSKTTTSDRSVALYISSLSQDIDVRNNVIVNGIENTTGTSKAFAIYVDVPYGELNPSDYNDLYAYGPEGILGYANSANRLTLAEWQTAISDDYHSISADPLFTSNTDLLPQTGSPLIGIATPLTGIVEDDFLSHPRSAATPTIGAYEISTGPTDKTLNLTILLEGLFNGVDAMYPAQDEFGNHWGPTIADHLTVELHAGTTPYGLIWSATGQELGTNGSMTVTVPNAYGSSYYIILKNRNHIETWSASPVSFAGAVIDYDFTDAASKAYGDNQKNLAAGFYGLYTGDENQDGSIDSNDLGDVDNDSAAFTFGYVSTDVNGDGFVDSNDMGIVDNNSNAFIFVMTP